jgi:hypothetical protein
VCRSRIGGRKVLPQRRCSHLLRRHGRGGGKKKVAVTAEQQLRETFDANRRRNQRNSISNRRKNPTLTLDLLGLGEEHPETLDPESSRNAKNGVRKNTGEGENSMKIEDETLTLDPQIPRNVKG